MNSSSFESLHGSFPFAQTPSRRIGLPSRPGTALRMLLLPLGVTLSLATAGVAHADTPVVDAPAASRPLFAVLPTGLSVTGQLGFTGTSDPGMSHFGGSALAGAQVIGHLSLFEAGVGAEYATNLTASRTAVSGLAGLGLSIHSFRVEALFELGEHDYSNVGGADNLFSSQPGVDGSHPFAGMRLNVTLPPPGFGGSSHVGGMGYFSFFVRRDLQDNVVNYSWTETSGFCCGNQVTESSTAVLGGVTEFGIALGGGFDIH